MIEIQYYQLAVKQRTGAVAPVLFTAGRIRIEWVSSQEQIADVLTKTLGAGPFIRLRDMLVDPVPSCTQ